SGRDPHTIILPMHQDYLKWCLANSIDLQLALMHFAGKVSFHMPSHKFLQLHLELNLLEKPLVYPIPVKGLTVFTGGSGRTGKAVVTWKEQGQWYDLVGREDESPQSVELRATAVAFQHFSSVTLNLVTDSAYVASVLQRLDRSALKDVNKQQLFHLLKLLWYELQYQAEPYYVLHIRSHTGLPGFVCEGNARADALAAPAWAAPVPDK
ncbi:POK19 protein, partial [Oxyruncus cristatus]|nr:POK19 protein [Oxyruncus cristatus]